jgi:cardiolipin synthase A/B
MRSRLLNRTLCLLLAGLALAGCATRQTRGIAYKIEPNYSVEDAQFQRTIGSLLGPSLVPGNKVAALINGDEIFPAMLDAIRGAEQSVNLETYIYWSGKVGDQFADALAERARAGVEVHVLVDWFASSWVDTGMFDRMRAAGVTLVRHNPLVWYSTSRINHRDHRKILVVDGQVGFIGGAGIGDVWLGNADSPGHWRDTMFRVEGPVVAQLQAAFMDNWIKSSGEVLDGEAYFPELLPAGDVSAQVFISSPKDGVENVRLMYLLSLSAARQSIRLSTPYFVPGDLTEEALFDACARGVQVEIIVPGAITDAKPVRHASRAKWGPLIQAGVRFYEYQPTMYHCKIMIVDDVWVSVGSANFDNRSFRLNDEANLNIYSRTFAEEQIRIFEEDKANSREVTYEQWKRRGLGKRLLEIFWAPLRSQL